MNDSLPLVLVPCFSGAPWDTTAFPSWRRRCLVTGALPDAVDVDGYADAVAGWTRGLDGYALVGDSFGALVALALARRRPRGLRALVLSGGFARADVNPWTRLRMAAGRFLGRAGYPLTVRMHVDSLGSPFDPGAPTRCCGGSSSRSAARRRSSAAPRSRWARICAGTCRGWTCRR